MNEILRIEEPVGCQRTRRKHHKNGKYKTIILKNWYRFEK